MDNTYQILYDTKTFKMREAIVEGTSKANAEKNFFQLFSREDVNVVEVRDQINNLRDRKFKTRLGNPPEYMK